MSGRANAATFCFEGLQRLEYRGYDSAGLSLVTNGSIGSVHAVGNLQHLRDAVAESNGHLKGSTGIGHTRWATHGRVTQANAHPHWDTSERFHIVLNGIVENWTELRTRLIAEGAEFTSETDAEVVAHLIASHFDGDLVEAVRLAYNELRGHYAFVAMSADQPDVLVGARKECPLVVGLGEGESFIASAIPAFMSETRNVQLVHDGEIVAVTPQGSRFISPDGAEIERDVDRVDWNEEQAEKGGYETFMLKEIHEQADAVAETVAGRVGEAGVELPDIGISDEFLKNMRRVVIVACGTSYHAGLVGRYAIEWWSRLPVEMDIASEFRYRNPVLDEHDLVIGISQSGETADTLAAMRLARERGANGARHHEHPGQPGHARLGRRALHARGPRDRRGRHQDVRGAGGGDVPVRPEARAAAREARAGRDQQPLLRAARDAACDSHARGGRRRPDQGDRRALEGRGLLPLPRPPRGPVRSASRAR